MFGVKNEKENNDNFDIDEIIWKLKTAYKFDQYR